MSSDARSRVNALLDVAVVVALGFAIRAVVHHFDVGVAGGSLSILAPLALATALLWRRGLTWRDLGFRRPPKIGTAIAWTCGLFLVDMLLIAPLTAALGSWFGWPRLQLDAFADLRGNFPRYLVLLIPVSWGSAAFGEELLFRGFLSRRLCDALGATRAADVAANLGQALLFGLGHAYLGPRGMMNAGLLGFAAGSAYRWSGRNLWPLIIAHGLVDTAGITALYLGATPH